MKNKFDYDAIIIGAGISGLVCGSYLARAGMRTLIVEKNANPGGYCTSFKRRGYHFDACVYFLSGFQKGSILYKIMQDLELGTELKLMKYPIPDIVITPDSRVNFHSNIDETISDLQHNFPSQKKAIGDFFQQIDSFDISSLMQIRNKSFKDVLDSFFEDDKLKTVLSIAIMGYTGLPPSQLSAAVAFLVYKGFIFDGGYYPKGGMQKFADTFAEKFREYGGDMIYSKKAQRIEVKGKKIIGISLDGEKVISAGNVIAACDAHETFYDLIGTEHLSRKNVDKIQNIQTSLSAFLVYLGVDKDLDVIPEMKSHSWIISKNHNSIEKIYSNLIKGEYDYLAISSSSVKDKDLSDPGKESMFLYTNTPFFEKEFWSKEVRERITDNLISIAEYLIPDLRKCIKMNFTATPNTLYKWTSNHNGAAYGYAATMAQFGDHEFSEKTDIEGLYRTGHWTGRGGGVVTVANSGYVTAKKILLKENKL